MQDTHLNHPDQSNLNQEGEIQFLKVIVDLSNQFINLTPNEIDDNLHHALRLTGELLKVDRCYIFRFNHDKTLMSNTHEWCAPEIDPQLTNLQDLQSADFPGWMERLNRFEEFFIEKVSDLSGQDEMLKEALSAQGIKSLLAVPLTYQNNLIGFMGLDSVKTEKTFSAYHIHILKLAANMIASAMIRKNTEIALIESEEKFRSLSETAATAIFIYQGPVFVYVNPMACELTGYSQEEMLGLNFWDVVHPDYAELVKQRGLARQRGEKVPNRYEFVIRTKNGDTRWLDFTSGMIQFGGKTAALGTAFDITERKQAEHSLQKSEMMYRELFDHANDIIYIHDLNGNFISLNETGEKLMGYTRKELTGESISKILPGYYLNLVRHMTTKQILNDLPALIYEIEILAKDGSLIPLELNTRLLFEDNQPVAIQGIARDITERKKAEHALSAEKERLSTTLKSIADAVISTDIHGRIIIFNEMAEQLTGWKADQALGESIDSVMTLINELTGEPEENPVHKILRKEAEFKKDSNLCLINLDRNKLIIADSTSAVSDPDGDLIGTVLVFRDITDRRRMQAERLKNQKIESLGILAGGIAHDFNNFLTAILGNISLTRMSMEKNQLNRMDQLLKEAESATLKARELTQQLLTFSKGGTPVRQTASVIDLLKESANFIVRGTACKLEFDIDEKLYPAEIDEGQINQVINNLVLNAVQAMPSGGTVHLQADNILMDEDSARILAIKPGKYVCIQVSDQGIGIPETYLSNIFDPYFTTKKMGSGLGLATSYSIIKKHDGAISVTSEPGVGTEFKVYLPASEKLTGRLKRPVKKTEVLGSGRILVMDDEQMIRHLLTEILDYLGFDVVAVSDGIEAIDVYRESLAQQNKFNLVIMDMTIPGGMGGRETIMELKKLDPTVKALVSSGYANDPIMADFKSFGFSGILAKPYRVEDLSAILEEVLRK
ncbi:MAG: PAS domain S-box protein [Bacteroidetes bacterium]|nr:PAS domain S-box protein [Bacteroidota bacterium]